MVVVVEDMVALVSVFIACSGGLCEQPCPVYIKYRTIG